MPTLTPIFVDNGKYKVLARAAVVIAPLVLLASLSGDVVWLRAGIVAISSFIALERANLAPAGVALHGVAMAAGFMVLLYSLVIPPLFVLCCVIMAAASILLTTQGARLRVIGNFTFIPALYLACELGENTARKEMIAHGLAFLPYVAVALIPTVILSGIIHFLERDPSRHQLRQFGQLRRPIDLGAPKPWKASMLAVALSVALAASLVEWLHLGNGQWVIWSAASVVTGDAGSARLKLRDRFVGVIAGVPLGLAIGHFVPHNAFAYGVVSILAIMSLVGVGRYVIEFGIRCACCALAILVTGQTSAIAGERVINVLMGGIIGIAFFLGVHAAENAVHARRRPKIQ